MTRIGGRLALVTVAAMPDILLTTLNAKYAHCAFGLRYLFANLAELQARAEVIEFTSFKEHRFHR